MQFSIIVHRMQARQQILELNMESIITFLLPPFARSSVTATMQGRFNDILFKYIDQNKPMPAEQKPHRKTVSLALITI